MQPEIVQNKETVSENELDQFVYHISHDVRASIRALRDLPTWIEADLDEAGLPVPETVSDSIKLLKNHTVRLDRMVLDLLVYSRVGRMQDIATAKLADEIDNVLSDMKVPASCRVSQNLKVANIRMGSRDIGTLLQILLSNAIIHGVETDGEINVSSHREGSMNVISVTDNGHGIDDRHHAKIFDMMSTLRPRDEVEGSGMGLAIASKICSHYGGHISVNNCPDGPGCQFQARIPS